MIANGNTYCRVITPILPPEYQEVEYIESSGTQYIDTGFVPNQDSGFEIKFLQKSISLLFMSRYPSFGIAINSNGIRYDYGNYQTDYNCNNTLPILAKRIKNECYFNNNLVITQTYKSFTCGYNLIAFGSNTNGSLSKNKHRIYYLKLYDNNTLVRNFIPCYRKSDNEIGMYDTVNKVFYTNQGTGTFLKGNNVVHTIRYKIEGVESIYHIRGTATDNFDFILKYIDRNNNITTVTEHAVIDENGKWDISYSGKYIYEMDTFYLNTNKNKITSFEFTEKLDYLHSFNTQAQPYRGIFFDCTNLTEIKFAQGTTFKSTTHCYNPFGNTKITELDLRDATFEQANQIQGFLNSVKNVITVRIDKIKSSVFFGTQAFSSSNSLVNLYVPQDSALNNDLVLSYSPLSYDSMIRVAGWLKDLTGLTSKTVTFKASTYDALTAEQKATLEGIIVTQKHWTLATA